MTQTQTKPNSRLSAQSLCVQYGDTTVIPDLSVTLPHGQTTVIIGANACGKSTLLKSMARLLTPTHGTVLLDGKDIHHQNTKDVARTLGVLPQTPIAPQGILVYDLVSRGRTPHQSAFRSWTQTDENAVTHALKQTGTYALAERDMDSLSGGQRQRVWIAMALAQDTDVVLLDEPTTFLDLPHQIDVLELIKRINANGDRTVVAVLHDLNLSCRYADHIIAMNNGKIVAQGTPQEIITPNTVQAVFDMDCIIIPDPITNTPMVIPK